MITNSNGNIFSFLSNNDKGSIPVVRTNPLAIYGNNLVYWLDFTDTSTLFTDTGATINVVNQGDFIRSIRSKSIYGQTLTATSANMTAFTYSTQTQFNGYGGIYKVGTGVTHFVEQTASIITGNTPYSVHFVIKAGPISADTIFYLLSQTGQSGSFYFHKDGSNKIFLANNGNIGTQQRVLTWGNNITIYSAFFNFSTVTNTTLYGSIPTNSFKDILNNNYNGPISYGTAGAALVHSIAPQRLRFLGLQGGVVTQPPVGFFVQEFLIARYDDDDSNFQRAHQYLRQKYLS
jgi:hypothetical protein